MLQGTSAVKDETGALLANDSSGSNSSALTVAMVLLASVVAAVVSQVQYLLFHLSRKLCFMSSKIFLRGHVCFNGS